MEKTSFLLGVHSHQPIDNFDHVVLDAAAKSYQPFFETMNLYPDFKFSAHFSGWLLEFIAEKLPDLFKLMKTMSKRGQVEWFSGGFYEPILASIPSRDRVRQINKLSNFIERHFAQQPKGLWLTERVWDGSIVADLVACGIEYAIIDDYHLLCAGVDSDRLNGWYLTENGGAKLGVFPISQALRYQAPFWEHNVVAENIAKTQGAAILFDDGEKFGVWPGTYDWCYEKGWLKKFAKEVLSRSDIETAHYRDFKAANKPLGVVYPADVSYAEMGEWSLKGRDTIRLERLKQQVAEEDRIFIRGSTWKNFLVKYEESARIHRRALALSAQNDDSQEFNDFLMKAQCNDCLWHGIFGGLYLPSLRDTAWRYLIAAEDYLIKKGKIALGAHFADWNLDGYDEARFVAEEFVAGFEPRGGKLTELNLLGSRFNLLNTLTRRFEAYHDKIELKNPVAADDDAITNIHHAKLSADENALKNLVTDRYARGGFIDHLVKSEFNLARFFAQDFEEIGDQPNTIYELREGRKQDGVSAALASEKIVKVISLKENEIKAAITILPLPEPAIYAQEHNFHFADLSQVIVGGKSAAESHEFESVKSLKISDPYLHGVLEIAADREFTAYTHPLYTVSQSESSVDLTAQGIAVALRFGKVGGEETHIKTRIVLHFGKKDK
ncbi:MAG: DUF1926 domain-containing protein [Helicobacteraceae bacterium]|jgi:hypothetical protein|nr:DUF1926 domain-containing protein [Helicobacteraceae bacterium]